MKNPNEPKFINIFDFIDFLNNKPENYFIKEGGYKRNLTLSEVIEDYIKENPLIKIL
jgi:hypothetical protein